MKTIGILGPSKLALKKGDIVKIQALARIIAQNTALSSALTNRAPQNSLLKNT